jgi:hypothetical protein
MSSAVIPRPTAVKWIVALIRIRLVFSLIAVVAAIIFMSPAESETMESFRRGWVRGTGFDVADYGPEQAGEVAGGAMVPALLMGLMLFFVRRRNLKALRISAAVSAVLAVGHFFVLVMSIATLVLAFRDSTRAYFGEPPRPGSRLPVRA